jgi:hypothetical protein
LRLQRRVICGSNVFILIFPKLAAQRNFRCHFFTPDIILDASCCLHIGVLCDLNRSWSKQ